MSNNKKGTRFPEWAPKNAGREFSSRVIEGKDTSSGVLSMQPAEKHQSAIRYDIEQIFNGVIEADRTILSKAITLIESNSAKHFSQAQELVRRLIPYSGKSIRIGITGVPGAGKSTFIESFGSWLIEQGLKVTVLAIDPSSTISKGSILGDKTRMEKLSRLENSFIRPSPTSGILGGVARKTRETIIACEAAGYDIILIETVGVGQSEVMVRSLVDFFLLLQITGAGDDLQGIKKGIIELSDLILINKADGDNVTKAEITKNDIIQVLHYLQPLTEGWKPTAITCSAQTGFNVPLVWKKISDFVQKTKANGTFERRRAEQMVEWFDTMLQEALSNLFFIDKELAESYSRFKKDILAGVVTPTQAVSQLITQYKN
jgi:LAO/AO transport system kinase